MKGRVTSVWISREGDLVITLQVRKITEQEALDITEAQMVNKYLNEEVKIELNK